MSYLILRGLGPNEGQYSGHIRAIFQNFQLMIPAMSKVKRCVVKGSKELILAEFNKHNVSLRNLVCFGADFASVLLNEKSGQGVLLQESYPRGSLYLAAYVILFYFVLQMHVNSETRRS